MNDREEIWRSHLESHTGGLLVEVKYFEPAEGDQGKATLNGRNHPDRYRYTNCWARLKDNVLQCCGVGREGWFTFHDNFCPKFLGEYPAVVSGQIDSSRADECDRLELYE